MNIELTQKGIIEKYPTKGGWYYIMIDKKYTDEIGMKSIKWGILKVKGDINGTIYDLSIMPFGGGRYFLPLRKAILDRQELGIGDKITIKLKVNL